MCCFSTSIFRALDSGARLVVLDSQDRPQSLQNPIFRPRCLPRGSKVAPKRPPNSILELLELDFEASKIDFKASRARFASDFGSTGHKKEDMYFLSDASTLLFFFAFSFRLLALYFVVFCFLLFASFPKFLYVSICLYLPFLFFFAF